VAVADVWSAGCENDVAEIDLQERGVQVLHTTMTNMLLESSLRRCDQQCMIVDSLCQ
jgi:hypothetical protein